MASKYHKESDESKKFLDSLTDFIGSSEDQTTEEVITDLQNQGVDIDTVISKCKKMIDEKIGEAKRQWMIDAPKLREKIQKQLESYQDNIPADINKLKEKIKELMSGGEYRDQAIVCFRNFNELPDDEQKQLYADFIALIQMQKDESKDNE